VTAKDADRRPGADTPTRDAASAAESARRLGAIVETEARRLLSEATLRPDPARVADGWERRFVADAARAEEAVELYERLGFEAVADPLRADEMGEDCEECRLLALLQFRTVYTRRRG
jgi:hypothetical protein